jgi:hypothetical protein
MILTRGKPMPDMHVIPIESEASLPTKRSEGSVLLGDQLLSLDLQYLTTVQMDFSPDFVGRKMRDVQPA